MKRPTDTIGGVPRWAWDVVEALRKFEAEHPKVEAGGWGCVKDILELVPVETRDLAQTLREAGIFEVAR